MGGKPAEMESLERHVNTVPGDKDASDTGLEYAEVYAYGHDNENDARKKKKKEEEIFATGHGASKTQARPPATDIITQTSQMSLSARFGIVGLALGVTFIAAVAASKDFQKALADVSADTWACMASVLVICGGVAAWARYVVNNPGEADPYSSSMWMHAWPMPGMPPSLTSAPNDQRYGCDARPSNHGFGV